MSQKNYTNRLVKITLMAAALILPGLSELGQAAAGDSNAASSARSTRSQQRTRSARAGRSKRNRKKYRKRKVCRRHKGKRRCRWVQQFQGHGVAKKLLRTAPLPRPSGDLHVYAVNFREELEVNIYHTSGHTPGQTPAQTPSTLR